MQIGGYEKCIAGNAIERAPLNSQCNSPNGCAVLDPWKTQAKSAHHSQNAKRIPLRKKTNSSVGQLRINDTRSRVRNCLYSFVRSSIHPSIPCPFNCPATKQPSIQLPISHLSILQRTGMPYNTTGVNHSKTNTLSSGSRSLACARLRIDREHST